MPEFLFCQHCRAYHRRDELRNQRFAAWPGFGIADVGECPNGPGTLTVDLEEAPDTERDPRVHDTEAPCA